MEVGIRPNVQGNVVAETWKTGGKLGPNPCEPIRFCRTSYILARISHTWTGVWRADATSSARLGECIGHDVITIIIAVVVILLCDEAPIVIMTGIIMDFVGVIRANYWSNANCI